MLKRIVPAILLLSFVCIEPASALTAEDMASMYNALARGDFATAIPLMRKGAAEGDTMSQKNLAALYTTGVPGVLEKSDAQALALYRQAAAKLDGDALAALGNAHVNGLLGVPRDYPKAKQYFEKAISLGNARGKAGLATLYLKGWSVEQNLTESFKLMREAAFQKVPGANYNLAEYYRKGIGCEKNPKEAESLYRKAAPGLVQQVRSAPQSGQLNCAVGILYQNGWGVPKDAKVAAQYFAIGVPKLKEAANKGNTTAMIFLAELNMNGWGIAKDSAAGEALLKKAAAAGDGEAKWELGLASASSQSRTSASESTTVTEKTTSTEKPQSTSGTAISAPTTAPSSEPAQAPGGTGADSKPTTQSEASGH